MLSDCVALSLLLSDLLANSPRVTTYRTATVRNDRSRPRSPVPPPIE